jgi:hypothetical protein
MDVILLVCKMHHISLPWQPLVGHSIAWQKEKGKRERSNKMIFDKSLVLH